MNEGIMIDWVGLAIGGGIAGVGCVLSLICIALISRIRR